MPTLFACHDGFSVVWKIEQSPTCRAEDEGTLGHGEKQSYSHVIDFRSSGARFDL